MPNSLFEILYTDTDLYSPFEYLVSDYNPKLQIIPSTLGAKK